MALCSASCISAHNVGLVCNSVVMSLLALGPFRSYRSQILFRLECLTRSFRDDTFSSTFQEHKVQRRA